MFPCAPGLLLTAPAGVLAPVGRPAGSESWSMPVPLTTGRTPASVHNSRRPRRWPACHRNVRDREEVTNSELPSTARCCGRRRASSDRQRARVLASFKARRSAPPPLRAHGLDAGSAHARPDWLLPTMPNPDPLHVVVDELSRMTPFRVTVDTGTAVAQTKDPRQRVSTARAAVP